MYDQVLSGYYNMHVECVWTYNFIIPSFVATIIFSLQATSNDQEPPRVLCGAWAGGRCLLSAQQTEHHDAERSPLTSLLSSLQCKLQRSGEWLHILKNNS